MYGIYGRESLPLHVHEADVHREKLENFPPVEWETELPDFKT